MPHVAETRPPTCSPDLGAAAHLDGDRLVVDDEAAFRGDASATSPGRRRSRGRADGRGRPLADPGGGQELGAQTASIHELYMARGPRRGPRLHRPGHQHPGPDLRHGADGLRDRRAADVGAVILELARSEQTYTYQRPIDYSTRVLAGAIAAGWHGPVFLQGDHYQFNAKKYAADPEAMTEEIRRACRLAIDAGYRNIDIDSSTLVDLSKPTVDEQQRENYLRAAELTALIRSLETDGVTISVGGEIGEVGKQNSTEEELRAYLDGYRRELERARRARSGSARSASRPARATAACRCPTAPSPRSSSTSRSSGGSARSPASTGWPAPSSTARRRCPTSCSTTSRRSRPPRSTSRPGSRTRSTSIRPSRPSSTRDRGWCFENAADERKADQTDEQFVYTTRKKAIGPFKRELWDLADEGRDPRGAAAQDRVPVRGARVDGSREMVDGYVHPVEDHRPLPESLRESSTRADRAQPGRPPRGNRRPAGR